MSELKPCPFGKAIPNLYHDTSSDYEQHWEWEIVSEYKDHYASASGFKTKEEAIAFWNTRPLEDAKYAEIERLQAIIRDLLPMCEPLNPLQDKRLDNAYKVVEKREKNE